MCIFAFCFEQLSQTQQISRLIVLVWLSFRHCSLSLTLPLFFFSCLRETYTHTFKFISLHSFQGSFSELKWIWWFRKNHDGNFLGRLLYMTNIDRWNYKENKKIGDRGQSHSLVRYIPIGRRSIFSFSKVTYHMIHYIFSHMNIIDIFLIYFSWNISRNS